MVGRPAGEDAMALWLVACLGARCMGGVGRAMGSYSVVVGLVLGIGWWQHSSVG